MRKTLIIISSLGLILFSMFLYVFGDQGLDTTQPLQIGDVRVVFDEYGVPTLEGPSWPAIIEAQGFVVAGERLFQMDLARRSARGGLAEWFGDSAWKRDEKVVAEDWVGVAEQAEQVLPQNDRVWCEAFARGVNRFIRENSNQWGVEYSLMRIQPEDWSCRDSLLVTLSMADRMSGFATTEYTLWAWRKHLSSHWQRFLFPDDHPWNQPIFGKAQSNVIVPPPPKEHLATVRIDSTKVEDVTGSPHATGSNSWAYRGERGQFLANDPHLNYQVPQTWYPIRMRIDADQWVAGMSLPGLPGVALGMNESLAWSFTNTGEDADDYLLEEVSGDQQQYVAGVDARGEKQWRPLSVKRVSVLIKGESPREVMVRKTHRGPIVQREDAPEKWLTRQWVALKDGVLGLPIQGINRAKDWSELNSAIDRLGTPAQNVVMMDREGNIGYRVSGTGVERVVNGRWPQPAVVGEWKGLEPASMRRRYYLANDHVQTKFPITLVTANQKIWNSEFGHNWFAEDRADRIREFLAAAASYEQKDMENLQVDTKSRYMRLLTQWIEQRVGSTEGAAAEVLKAWREWDGVAQSGRRAFTDALVADRALANLLVSRVKHELIGKEASLPQFKYFQQRAWMVYLLSEPDSMRIFGLIEADVARFLLDAIVKDRARDGRQLYDRDNRMSVQHPFVGRIPFLGEVFRVKELPQSGYDYLVKAEGNRFGASVRVVYDLKNPTASTWAFPVGQSGHVFSKYYRSFQDDWHRNTRLPMLDSRFTWN